MKIVSLQRVRVLNWSISTGLESIAEYAPNEEGK